MALSGVIYIGIDAPLKFWPGQRHPRKGIRNLLRKDTAIKGSVNPLEQGDHYSTDLEFHGFGIRFLQLVGQVIV